MEFYDPYDAEVSRDPYPVYARLRETAPVYRSEKFDFWALSRHADVSMVMRDGERFSSANGNNIEATSWGPNAYKYASIIAMDPPMHSRVRGGVARHFVSRRMKSLERFTRDTAASLLDSLLDKGEFEFVTEFAQPLPVEVLSELIGIPAADRPRMRHLAFVTTQREMGAADPSAAAIMATLELMSYFGDLVADRRKQRRDDLVSHLLDDVDEQGHLADEEIVAFLHLLISAAIDTVFQLLGNAWYWAWRNPEQRAAALGGEVTGWIEETLRYDTPNQFAARTALTDIELHGVVIPEQARILLLPGAANRDPAVFPDPERYDLSRDTSRQVTFGHGRHLCLGVHLARLEAKVAIEEIVARVRDYEIDEAGIELVPAAVARGFLALPTTTVRR
jgi:cytochrome P450